MKEVLLQALELPEGERADFAALACGDDQQLRREVDSLLASHLAADDFCETPAAALLDRGPPVEQRPRLGP